jgi:hypothetical protein
MACNQGTQLCDRPIDEVVFAASHNSMSSAERGWLAPNHSWAVPTQLHDGIRSLNLDVYEIDGVPMLCHGYCSLGEQLLVDGLAEIRAFLDANPHEVLILSFEMYASSERVSTAFDEAGLTEHAHALEPGSLPTLRALIEADERLLVFTSSGGGSPEWYHSWWDWWWDNPYAAETPEDFSCAVDRGHEDSPLMSINHFLTAPIGMQVLAQEANTLEVLQSHITDCIAAAGRKPNQVIVDFYSTGALLDVVDELNR